MVLRKICTYILLGILCIEMQGQVIDKMVAKVGSEVILYSELQEQIQYMKSQGIDISEQEKCQLLQNMVIENLLVHQAKIDSIIVSDEEVQEQLDARVDQMLRYMGNDIERFKEYYRMSPVDLKNQMRDILKNQMLSERMRSQMLSSITSTPKEVVSFYENLDTLPYYSAEIEYSEIVFIPKPNDIEKSKSLTQILEIKKRIEEGEDFAELAKKYSDDPGSGANGGSLGWAQRGSYVPEFEAAAYNLRVGELSHIVETEFGYHLIELMERRGNKISLRHILVTPEITDEDYDLVKEKAREVKELITNDSLTFEEAVEEYSSDKEASYNYGGRVVNPMSGTTFFEVDQMDPDVYLTTFDMQAGEISEPIEFITQRGEIQYKIIRLDSKAEPHAANLKQDYAKMHQASIESKKNEFFLEWLKEKSDDTYFYFDPILDGCPTIASLQGS